jgi:hypothetical protein
VGSGVGVATIVVGTGVGTSCFVVVHPDVIKTSTSRRITRRYLIHLSFILIG